MRTLVVNFFAGPGAGKSTLAAGLFYKLKQQGINAELVREYAKELVWSGDYYTLSRQLVVSAEQYRRQCVLYGKVPVIVTDSPIILGCIYQDIDDPLMIRECLDEMLQVYFHQAWNLNYLVKREGTFESKGRIENAEQSVECDQKILRLLHEMNVNVEREPFTKKINLDILVHEVMEKLKEGEPS